MIDQVSPVSVLSSSSSQDCSSGNQTRRTQPTVTLLKSEHSCILVPIFKTVFIDLFKQRIIWSQSLLYCQQEAENKEHYCEVWARSVKRARIDQYWALEITQYSHQTNTMESNNQNIDLFLSIVPFNSDWLYTSLLYTVQNIVTPLTICPLLALHFALMTLKWLIHHLTFIVRIGI